MCGVCVQEPVCTDQEEEELLKFTLVQRLGGVETSLQHQPQPHTAPATPPHHDALRLHTSQNLEVTMHSRAGGILTNVHQQIINCYVGFVCYRMCVDVHLCVCVCVYISGGSGAALPAAEPTAMAACTCWHLASRSS